MGRCKSFEASADGYGRGEGFNAIVMQASGVSSGNTAHALALIQGSAVNQDGRSSSLTAPNGPAQQVRLSMKTDYCLNRSFLWMLTVRLTYIVLDGTNWAACLCCKKFRICVSIQHMWFSLCYKKSSQEGTDIASAVLRPASSVELWACRHWWELQSSPTVTMRQMYPMWRSMARERPWATP